MAKRFIKMISQLNEQRYVMHFQRLIDQKTSCGIFIGDNNNVKDANSIISQLINMRFNMKCICLIEEDKKSYFNYDKIQTLSLNEFDSFKQKPQVMLMLSSSFFSNTFHQYFNNLGLGTLLLTSADQAESLYNYVHYCLPEIFNGYSLLADDESKQVFCQFLKARISNRLEGFRFAPEQQYWLEGFFPVKDDVVIDGGAYDGGTSIDFAMQGAKVYAFELDDQNYKKCLERSKEYNFVIENMGLSSEESESSYVSHGASSHKADAHGGGQ